MEEGEGERAEGKQEAMTNKDLFFNINGCNQSRECDTGEMKRVISRNERERLKTAERLLESGYTNNV